jgi:DNA-binding NarL/FixJ family response regulator
MLAADRSAAAGRPSSGRRSRSVCGRSSVNGPSKSAASFPQLREGEGLILDKLAAGLTNVDIGHALFHSPKTVANNVAMVLAKLHLSGRGQAIVLARAAGLGRSGQLTCRSGTRWPR